MNPAELLRRLVEIPSPTGSEAAAVRFLQDQARGDGFHVESDAAGNFVAETGTGGRLILFVGHVDTVPGHIPVRVEAGELWGRGAVDAKGSLAAFYAAARALRDTPHLRIRIVGAVDEEGLSRGAKAIPDRPAPEAILIGEPSGADALTLGYKGVVRGEFRIERERMHGAHPGRSAPDEAIAFWADLRARLGAGDAMDGIQARLESLNTETDHLRDEVRARFNLRVPWGASATQTADQIRGIAAAHRIQLDVREVIEPAWSGRGNPLAHAYTEALRSCGFTPRFKRKSGTSDFNTMRSKFPGVPLLAYGPGDAALDHTPHERLPLAQLERAVEVHRAALARLASRTQPIAFPSGKSAPRDRPALARRR